jgi:hypothetical protein
MEALSPIGIALYDKINAAGSPPELGDLQRDIWGHYWPSQLGDAEAQFLADAIEQRKPKREFVAQMPVGRLKARVSSRFQSRQRPRSPDRQASRDRRRTLGSSSSMPPTMRARFTEGQRSVLAIVAGEVKRHGICDLPYDKIAALAGVCRTTVQTTMHEARRLGLLQITERPRPGRKNLTNLLRIASREWLTWIKRGPAAHKPAYGDMPNRVQSSESGEPHEELRFKKEEALQVTRGTDPPYGIGLSR